MKLTSKTCGRLLWAAVLALPACVTPDQDELTAGTPQASDDGDTAPPIGDGATTDPSATSGDTGGSDEDDDDGDTGCTFIDCPTDTDDNTPAPECDVFAQDCPDGEKCMPWANDGGGEWNDTRCVPLSDTPGQVGDTCMVEGSGTSGVDDCEIGAMCWNSDPETNLGTCIGMCTGDAQAPLCDDPDTACSITNDGVLILCLPACDPLLQDCAEGEACYPVNDHFACAPDSSGDMGAAGDGCEYINACDAGNICANAAVWPDCAGSAGCCTPVCDVSDPEADDECPGDGQLCQAWYEEGAAPPGSENVGVCALPG